MSENKSLNNIIEKVEASIREDQEKEAKLKKRKRKRRTALVIFLLIILGAFGLNEGLKWDACNKLAKNLPGMTFENEKYNHKMKLSDSKNKKKYDFYGAKSTYVFNEDGTVTWTRQFGRNLNNTVYTDPVTTTETYEVKYLGNFLYDKTAIYVVLGSGDILYVDYDYKDPTARTERRPNSVDYSILHDDKFSAPEELMNIDTSYVSGSSSSKSSSKSSSSSKSNSSKSNMKTCPSCGKKVSSLITRKDKAGVKRTWCSSCWADYNKIIGK